MAPLFLVVLEAPNFIMEHGAPRGYYICMLIRANLLVPARSANVGQNGYFAKTATDDDILTKQGFTTSGTLTAAIAQSDGFVNGQGSNITINEVQGTFPTPTGSDQANGNSLILINGEIMSYGGITGPVSGVFTLTGVERALLDTSYEAHAIDDVVYLLDVEAISPENYDQTESISAIVTSFTERQEESAAAIPITFSNRNRRPLPVDNISLDNGGGASRIFSPAVSVEQGANVTVAWARRDIRATVIPTEDDADDDPADGTQVHSYTVSIVDDADSGDSANDVTSHIYTVPADAPSGAQVLRVIVNDGTRDSLPADVPIQITVPPPQGLTIDQVFAEVLGTET